MRYRVGDSDEFIINRQVNAVLRKPGEVDITNLVVHLPDCVTAKLGAIGRELVETLRDRRYDYAPIEGLSTDVGWGLVNRTILEALQPAGVPLAEKDVDRSDRVIWDTEELVSLSQLFGFFTDYPAVLLVGVHRRSLHTPDGTQRPTRGFGPGDGSRVVTEGRIFGLLTLSDLDHRDVRRAAYELLHELELKLVELLRLQHPDPWTWINLIASEDERARIIDRWELMRRQGGENSPETMLTLPQLLGIAGKSGWMRERLGIKSRSDLDARVRGLVDFRNRTMHPVRLLVSAHEDIARFIHATRGLGWLLEAVERGRAE